MIQKIDNLVKEIEGLVANSAEELEALRLKYLSKKGIINDLMADFRNVPAEQKREVGQKLKCTNERVRQIQNQALTKLKQLLMDEAGFSAPEKEE